MVYIKEKLNDLKKAFNLGEIEVEELQRSVTKLLLSSGLQEAEEVSRKFDNDFELVIYTLNPPNQIEASLKIINEAIKYVSAVAPSKRSLDDG